MITEAFITSAAAVTLYYLMRMRGRWLSARKMIAGANSKVTIEAQDNLDFVKFTDSVMDKDSKKPKPMEFSRKNIKKGEKLEFNYPASKGKITITAKKGNEEKKFDIGIF